MAKPFAAATAPQLIVIGGGFAGLWATRALKGAPIAITLIDRANHHLFQPLLYQVATAGLSAPDIAAPLRHILREDFRRIDPAAAQVRLIEAGPAVLASFPPTLQARTRQQLEALGVQVLCGAPVAGISELGYRLGDGFVPCRTVLWAAGVAASPLGAMLGAERDRAGRVKVLADLSLPGHPEVHVAGDLAAVLQADGRPVPGVAPAAKQMGRHVAASIRAGLASQTTTSKATPGKPFVYADYGNLATIGRMAAVVDLRGLHFSGLPAWWFWLGAHVFFLIGFRNRLSVLINWAWAYWTYQRGARIVLGGSPAASGPAAAPAPTLPADP